MGLKDEILVVNVPRIVTSGDGGGPMGGHAGVRSARPTSRQEERERYRRGLRRLTGNTRCSECGAHKPAVVCFDVDPADGSCGWQVCDECLAVVGPRPSTDAAAVVAVIVADCARVLRKASQVADDNGLRGLSGSLSRDADRIEAAHPQAEPVTDWRESYRRASAALDAARDAAAEPITGPYAHLYTREEALKLMRYSSYETTKAGTSVLDFPALLDATVKR